MSRRIVIRMAAIVALFAVGLFLLIRSLLSRHDERAAMGSGGGSQSASQFLVFEKEGKSVIFSLVRYDRTVSYSRQGGSVRKSIKSTYYAQSNDLATAAKTGSQKIKTHNEIKAYPVELIGASANKAWLFAGELMAWDPFTLTLLADAEILEQKNPGLGGKLIHERRYYSFDDDAQQIIITAADGARYGLNTATLVAALLKEEDSGTNMPEKRLKELDKQRKELNDERREAYDRFREFNSQYREKKISVQPYKDSTSQIEKRTKELDRLIDSLDLLVRETRDNQNEDETARRMKENSRRTGSGFNAMRINCDTLNGTWYGLYTLEKLERIGDRFSYQTVYDETARNRLYTAQLTGEKKNRVIGESKQAAGDAVYLQGGFLPDKETGIPIHLTDGFLITHKDRIGNEGIVQLTRITTVGRQLWTLATGLKEFYDWKISGDKLVITGTDNAELSSGQINVLLIIDLKKGTSVIYDYFADKVKK